MDKGNNYEKIRETHQIENARQRKLRRRKLSYIFLLLLIIFAFFYLCYRYLFRVVTVEYIGNEYYTVEMLSEAFGVKEGDRLFSYSKAEKEQLMLESFPYLEECEIKRTVPDKITVTVLERNGIMYTYVSDKYIIFDKEMFVVEISDSKPADLLEVKFEDSLLVKCVLGEEIVFKDKKSGVGLYRVYESLSASPVFEKTKYITMKSRFDYYVQYGESFEIYLGDSTECSAKLLFVCGIMEKLSEESRGKIDVSNPSEGYFKELG